MSAIHLNNNYHRVCPGHPVSMPVHTFFRASKKTGKQYLTVPYSHPALQLEPYNVLVASCNSTISKALKAGLKGVRIEHQPLTIAKHLGEVLQVDVVVVMNTYCDLASKEQAWDVYYHKSASTPLYYIRMNLQYERDE